MQNSQQTTFDSIMQTCDQKTYYGTVKQLHSTTNEAFLLGHLHFLQYYS